MAHKINGKVAIRFDFYSAEDAITFVDELRLARPDFYAQADAFEMDALDTQERVGGITSANTFVFRNGRDWIPGSSLRELVDQPPVVRTIESAGATRPPAVLLNPQPKGTHHHHHVPS